MMKKMLVFVLVLLILGSLMVCATTTPIVKTKYVDAWITSYGQLDCSVPNFNFPFERFMVAEGYEARIYEKKDYQGDLVGTIVSSKGYTEPEFSGNSLQIWDKTKNQPILCENMVFSSIKEVLWGKPEKLVVGKNKVGYVASIKLGKTYHAKLKSQGDTITTLVSRTNNLLSTSGVTRIKKLECLDDCSIELYTQEYFGGIKFAASIKKGGYYYMPPTSGKINSINIIKGTIKVIFDHQYRGEYTCCTIKDGLKSIYGISGLVDEIEIIDRNQPGSISKPTGNEICNNTQDDDGDGKTDCEDSNCDGFIFKGNTPSDQNNEYICDGTMIFAKKCESEYVGKTIPIPNTLPYNFDALCDNSTGNYKWYECDLDGKVYKKGPSGIVKKEGDIVNNFLCYNRTYKGIIPVREFWWKCDRKYNVNNAYHCDGKKWHEIKPESCTNRKDDDWDGKTDCEDPDCNLKQCAGIGSACVLGKCSEIICNDKKDNDWNSAVGVNVGSKLTDVIINEQIVKLIGFTKKEYLDKLTIFATLNKIKITTNTNYIFTKKGQNVTMAVKSPVVAGTALLGPMNFFGSLDLFTWNKDCFDGACILAGQNGPGGARCCSPLLGCGKGASCLNTTRECKETSCINKKDDDGDNLDDCKDSDCDGLTCDKAGTSMCINKICTKIPEAKKAAIKQVVPKIQIFSYLDILKMLNKCKVRTGSATSCSNICQLKETGFPTKWSKNTITRCTCC